MTADTPPVDAQPVEPTYEVKLHRRTPSEQRAWHEGYIYGLKMAPEFDAARAGDGLREALEIIAAPPIDAPDGIGVKARNIARAALHATATKEKGT